MKVIGLAGPAGCGKDAVAELILKHRFGFRYAFADPLRQAAMAMFGLSMEQMTDRVLKERLVDYWGKSPRQILQLLGTEAGRDVFGADIWVKRARKRLYETLHTDVVVFSDVRTDVEADFIRDEGGLVIHIVRPGVEPVSGHSTEAGIRIDDADQILNNSGDLVQLNDVVKESLPVWLSICDPVVIPADTSQVA